MSRAILITDMPEEGCVDCKFWEDDICDSCYAMDERLIDDIGERPDWCPLIAEPERKDPHSNLIGYSEIDSVRSALAYGFNECLDALEGKENE